MIPTNLLPAGTRYCIAGGWAACPALAADMDLWVYGVPEGELQERRAALITHLAANNFDLMTEACREIPQPQYQHCRTTLKVGVVTRKGDLPVHILVTSALTIRDILDGFDVSTHAVAIGGDSGFVVKGKGWTPPHVAPVALYTNEKTPERMMRIAARFGHKTVEVPVGEGI